MNPTTTLFDEIHFKALEASSRYKRAVADLVDILQEVEAHQVHLVRGHSSLFAYAVAELGLGENVIYSLITIARKAREVPELKECLKAGKMTFSNARRVVSVLTVQNKKEWLQKAAELSSRKLQKEIVKVRPIEATFERASYATPDRVRLEIGLSEKEMLSLRRVQDLLCQSQRRPVSLEEVIQTLTHEFLRRLDPLEKAKRHQVRKGGANENAPGMASEVESKCEKKEGIKPDSETRLRSETRPESQVSDAELVTPRAGHGQFQRRPIPAAVLHQVNLRDQRRCTFVLPDGCRCNQTRWLDVHHRVQVSQGGTNSLENLITLCSSHHRLLHLREESLQNRVLWTGARHTINGETPTC